MNHRGSLSRAPSKQIKIAKQKTRSQTPSLLLSGRELLVCTVTLQGGPYTGHLAGSILMPHRKWVCTACKQRLVIKAGMLVQSRLSKPENLSSSGFISFSWEIKITAPASEQQPGQVIDDTMSRLQWCVLVIPVFWKAEAGRSHI